MRLFLGYMFFVDNRPGAALELVAVEVAIRKVFIFAEQGRTTTTDTSALLERVLRYVFFLVGPLQDLRLMCVNAYSRICIYVVMPSALSIIQVFSALVGDIST